ncbi:hypothetical protein GGR54DRAFT_339574 [Hypoxylon sp. NC1633]|nr:hypothetical protein GGR54DRAFT_339574 [Hypoxylon sp. NC1633]
MAANFTSLFYISIWLLAGQVSCGSIAAWWNARGPSFIMQDDQTGSIRYSLCNGNYTPIYPNDEAITVPFTSHPPKGNTSLAATGWLGDTAYASIFYLDDKDEIVNSLLKCDWNSGKWQNTGEWIISGGSPKMDPSTGLAVVLLGAADGYRVFYNDLEGSLHQIGYTSTTSWGYYGLVSPDKMSAQAISATFTGSNNISIVRVRDDKNIGVSRLYSDHLWHLSTFPESLTLTGNHSTNATEAADLNLNTTQTSNFSLPAWNGTASSLAIGVDKAYTRSVFYIGTDRKLYQVANKNYQWGLTTRPSSSSATANDTDGAWPDADAPGTPLGIASDASSSALRLYYQYGGRIVEANGDGGTWQPAVTLASFNASQPTATPSSTSSSSATASATAAPVAQSTGLSDGAKAGVAVGVVLGVLAIGGMSFAFWFLRRRQRQLDEANKSARPPSGSEQYTGVGSASGAAFSQDGSHDGFGLPGGSGYSPVQTGAYAQGYQPQMGYAYSGDGGGWTYVSPSTDGGMHDQHQQQGQYFYHAPQELPDQVKPVEMTGETRPVEMMGEGHYKEVP